MIERMSRLLAMENSIFECHGEGARVAQCSYDLPGYSGKHAEYLAHSANAYPELVDALQKSNTRLLIAMSQAGLPNETLVAYQTAFAENRLLLNKLGEAG